MTKQRNYRVGEEIKKEMSRLILEDMKDPRLKGLISVTHVAVTNDLSSARVYVSIMATPEEQAITFNVLKKASGYFRSKIAQVLSTYNTPEIVFEEDQSLAYGAKINRLLADINQEKGEE